MALQSSAMTVAPFPTTRRSVLAALSSADATECTRAFDTLVACYWKPLYEYARVSWRRSREDAEDLTQGFFVRAFGSAGNEPVLGLNTAKSTETDPVFDFVSKTGRDVPYINGVRIRIGKDGRVQESHSTDGMQLELYLNSRGET